MKDVRKGFSKSFISLSDGRVSARYLSTPEYPWATQCFNDEGNQKAVFETLLANADGFDISISAESGVEFGFSVNDLTGIRKAYIFYPTEHNVTDEEFWETLMRDYPERFLIGTQRFLNSFSDIDLDDEDAVLQRAGELILAKSNPSEIVDFEGLSTWAWLDRHVSDFSEEFEFGFVESFPPDASDDFRGCVEISTSLDEGKRYWNFSEESKDTFLELVSVATELDIECGFQEGEEILNITFHA